LRRLDKNRLAIGIEEARRYEKELTFFLNLKEWIERIASGQMVKYIAGSFCHQSAFRVQMRQMFLGGSQVKSKAIF